MISPLLANTYLNELDWELEKEGIKFVRYCDDFLLFAKTDEEIRRAGAIAKILNIGENEETEAEAIIS